MKRIKKILLVLFIPVLVMMVIVYFIAWRSPAYYETITIYNPADSIVAFKNYGSIIHHPRPYIIQQPRLVIFGASHTRDPLHAEIPVIEKKWNEVQPTVALIEGRLGFLLPGLMDPVKTLGEGGKVKALASKSNVPVYNWDLSKEKLATAFLQKFTAEQVALSQVLNPYFGNMRFGNPASPEKFIEPYFKRASYTGMQDAIKSVADIDRLWKKYFPREKDWRNTSDEYALPGYLDEMLAAGNDVRNQHLVTVIKELQAKGESVFVICGSSHAACIAPAFQ
jgi:hypothetical protein